MQGGMRGGMQGGMRGGMQGGMRGPGMQRPGGEMRMQFPLMIALDADKNGEISAEEIKNAAKALKTLDKNKNGKLEAEEIRPQGRGPGGEGRPGGPGAGPGPGGRPAGGAAFADRIMQLDKNGDGKVSKDELPERMQHILNRADTDGDGAISKEEAQKMGGGR